jgi:hypothetical protein
VRAKTADGLYREGLELLARTRITVHLARTHLVYGEWLADHVPHPGIEAVTVHPGVIATGLLHAMFAGCGGDPEPAARALVEVAGRSGDSGTYYDETRPAEANPVARDRRFQQRLLDLTTARLSRRGFRVELGSKGR